MEDLIGVYGILDLDHWPERSVFAAGRRGGKEMEGTVCIS